MSRLDVLLSLVDENDPRSILRARRVVLQTSRRTDNKDDARNQRESGSMERGNMAIINNSVYLDSFEGGITRFCQFDCDPPFKLVKLVKLFKL